jgi:UDPglucose 6-dehydrogenase
MAKNLRISVVGAGYAGLVTAAGFAKGGFRVTCVDVDEEKVKVINQKKAPIYEAGLDALLGKVVPSKLQATTNLHEAVMNSDVTFICVGTPSKKRGETLLNQIEEVAAQIGKVLRNKKSHLVVVKSTVVPGTTEETVIPALEKNSGKRYGVDFGVAMNPEFLREGAALQDFLCPDRIVFGSTDQRSFATMRRLYKKFRSITVETSFKEAEMIKYASNAFLATKLSFINEVGNVCKLLGIDTNVVARGIGLDKRIGPHFLRCGIGFGGSCFPKDVNAIVYKAAEKGYNTKLLRAVLEVNDAQPLKLLELLEALGMRKKKLAILGLTFKGGTDDIRESPAIEIIKELLTEDVKMNVYDPMAMSKVKKIFPHLNYVSSAQEAVDSSDIVLILSDWDEFTSINYREKPVIDGKNVFSDKTKRPINYEGICW